jgi:hypothetical protein
MYFFSHLWRFPLDNCSYFVGAGLDTFGGNQIAQFFVSCYSKDTLLQLSLRLASCRLVKVSVRSEMYDSLFLLATMISLT